MSLINRSAVRKKIIHASNGHVTHVSSGVYEKIERIVHKEIVKVFDGYHYKTAKTDAWLGIDPSKRGI